MATSQRDAPSGDEHEWQGDPRLTPKDREILLRISVGDLADEFAEALASDLEHDPLVGGHDARS